MILIIILSRGKCGNYSLKTHSICCIMERHIAQVLIIWLKYWIKQASAMLFIYEGILRTYGPTPFMRESNFRTRKILFILLQHSSFSWEAFHILYTVSFMCVYVQLGKICESLIKFWKLGKLSCMYVLCSRH